MYDVTDTVFRQIIANLAAPDMYMTEFVNVDGLQSIGRDHLMRRLCHTKEEQNLVAHIWGTEADNFYKTANELVDMGFVGVDLNMGCPDKTIVKRGCCSGLIRNRTHAIEIIKATQAGVAGRVPVSVKTRLGFDKIDFTWHELLLQQSLDMLSIHGRIAKQKSRGKADWASIGSIRELRDKMTLQTRIVGNGDVMSRSEGNALAERHGLDGIMIGRGVFHDPFVFAEESPWASYDKRQRLELYMRHVTLFAETWRHAERPIEILNKFCKIYVNNFDGAQELREQLMAIKSTDEILRRLSSEIDKKLTLR
jgi:tRNA-dihydrouridine synthase